MINAVLSLPVLGKDGATMDKVVKGESSNSSRPDARVRKDVLSSRHLTSSLDKGQSYVIGHTFIYN